MRLPVPDVVRGIAARLEEAGFETWTVGGAVRDALLGLPQRGDWDLTTAAPPQQVRRLFRRTVPVGIVHGTVGVLDDQGRMHEVTTFRRDVETTGRHAVVEFGASLEEDLARRDFTMNAIAWHPLREELRDPHGGQEDLRARRLRTVGDARERFAEDYLRVLRALRFAGRFDLSIDADTWHAIPAALEGLTGLSGERVREELWKVMAAGRPSAALRLYESAGALGVLYPELHSAVGLRAREGDALDAWGRALAAVDALPPTRPIVRVAALLHPIGMTAARTRDLRGGFSYVGHPVAAARRAEELMRRLRASNAEIDRVRRLVLHQEDFFPPDAPESGIRRWLRDVGPDLVADLMRLRIALERADAAAVPRPIAADVIQRMRAARRLLAGRPPLAIGQLAIGGAELGELGIPPGPRYGEILRTLLDEVIERPELNTRENLMEKVRQTWAP